MQHRFLSLAALSFALAACTSVGDGADASNVESSSVSYEDANEREGVDVAGAQAERVGRAEVPKADVPTVAFGELRIDPEEPTVDSILRASVEFKTSADGYSDYDLSWYVGGLERVGIRSRTLDARLGRFKKGDLVSFKASTLDPKGIPLEAKSKSVFIGNSTPVITTDASRRRGLDGLRLKATDADGDPITWAIAEGPPGVSIDKRGRVRVKQMDLAEAFDGEVVISATDPDGARAEFHVPVTINAAIQEKKGERKVTRTHTRESMSAAEFEKANLDNLQRVEKMSSEEFEAYTKQQEEAAERRRKASGQ